MQPLNKTRIKHIYYAILNKGYYIQIKNNKWIMLNKNYTEAWVITKHGWKPINANEFIKYGIIYYG